MNVNRRRLMTNFSRAAGQYDGLADFQHGETARVFDAARMVLEHDARILDLGCGTGQFAARAATVQPHWNVTGLDIAFGMCQTARDRCRTIQADAQTLPIRDATFDAVVSSLCLQWVPDGVQAFAEIARVLRPGGRVILASLGQASLSELRIAAAAAALPLEVLPLFPLGTYRAWATAAGLRITLAKSTCAAKPYASVGTLLESMRSIGAGNNFSGAARGLTGASRWKAMVRAYEMQRTDAGIPATWERIFLILRKPA